MSSPSSGSPAAASSSANVSPKSETSAQVYTVPSRELRRQRHNSYATPIKNESGEIIRWQVEDTPEARRMWLLHGDPVMEEPSSPSGPSSPARPSEDPSDAAAEEQPGVSPEPSVASTSWSEILGPRPRPPFHFDLSRCPGYHFDSNATTPRSNSTVSLDCRIEEQNIPVTFDEVPLQGAVCTFLFPDGKRWRGHVCKRVGDKILIDWRLYIAGQVEQRYSGPPEPRSAHGEWLSRASFERCSPILLWTQEVPVHLPEKMVSCGPLYPECEIGYAFLRPHARERFSS